MWFYNRLASKGEKYYWLPTKIMKKKLPTTDGKFINWLPTWTDIIDICFHKEELALGIFSSLVSNHIKYDLSDGPPLLLRLQQLLQTISKSRKSYLKEYRIYKLYFLKKRWKTFRWTSQVLANTPKNEIIEIVCSVNENFYKDNTLPAGNA